MDATILPVPENDRPVGLDERSRFRAVFFDAAPAITAAPGGFAEIAWVAGHPRSPMAAGLVVTAIGFVLMGATLGSRLWAVFASSFVFGLEPGTTMPAAQIMAQWAAGSAQLGVVTAALSFVRSIGGVLGAAATFAILLAALQMLAPDAPAQVQTILSSFQNTATPSPASPEVQAAFRWVFSVMAAIAFLAAAVAGSIPDIDLSAQTPPRDARS